MFVGWYATVLCLCFVFFLSCSRVFGYHCQSSVAVVSPALPPLFRYSHYHSHTNFLSLPPRRDKNKLMFLFLGTEKFNKKVNRPEEHPQIIYLPTNSDLRYKEDYIKTCDVMLHARTVGETFGLAVAEFSVRNKPVITFPGD